MLNHWYLTPFEMITRTMGTIMKVVINVFFGYNVVNQHNLLNICPIRKHIIILHGIWDAYCLKKKIQKLKKILLLWIKSHILDALCLIFMIKDNLNNKELFLFFIDELSVTYSKYWGHTVLIYLFLDTLWIWWTHKVI